VPYPSVRGSPASTGFDGSRGAFGFEMDQDIVNLSGGVTVTKGFQTEMHKYLEVSIELRESLHINIVTPM
jgi:hypothetical protein